MKEYEVTITETLQKTVSIEAESSEEAERLIEDMWKDSEIILDSDDFYDVSYAAGKEKEIEKENNDIVNNSWHIFLKHSHTYAVISKEL